MPLPNAIKRDALSRAWLDFEHTRHGKKRERLNYDTNRLFKSKRPYLPGHFTYRLLSNDVDL